MKKQALGKGLKAFLSDDYGILKEERYAEIDIELIKPNPLQPRKFFDPKTLGELADSIKESGLLQPIIVIPENDQYKIIVGERRWRAAQQAGLEKIPVLIRNLEEEKQIEASLIENIQREDLNPLEIAQAFQKMIDVLHYSQAEVAEKVGKDRASVTNYIRLLKLPEEVKNLLADRSISMGHARALISVEDPDIQKRIAEQVAEKSLSVRDVEKMINNLKTQDRDRIPQEPDPDLLALEEELMRILGTKTTISGTQKKGSIKIHFYSLEDLNRIYEIIKGEKT
jgi:ParB family chromosome partitioning protein